MAVRLIDRGLKRITREFGRLIGAKVSIGFDDDEVAEYALFQEFGFTDRGGGFVFPKPFMRRAISENRSEIRDGQAKIIRAVIAGRFSAKDGAEAMGDFIRRLIIKQIDTASSWARPLAASTIAKKGHARPLEDSKDMRNSLTVKVQI